MPKKTQQDLKKKQRNQIIMLVVILVAFLALMAFVTLPALGINLFGSGSSTSSRPVSTVQKTQSKPNSTTTTTTAEKPDRTTTNKELLKKALEKDDQNKVVENFRKDAFEPYYFNFKDAEQVREILVNSGSVIEFDDAVFMSYFLSEDGEKTAWIKTSAEPNKVYELKINSRVPNVPYPLQVIEITPMGVLLYRYPDEQEKAEEETPRLYRLLARPYIEITELKATIK